MCIYYFLNASTMVQLTSKVTLVHAEHTCSLVFVE